MTSWADANKLFRFETLRSGGKNSESTCEMLEPPSCLDRRMRHKLTQGLTRHYEVNCTLV